MTSAGGRSPPPPSSTIFLACCNTCLATRIRPPRPTLGPPMTNQEPLPATFAGQLPFTPTSACITPGLVCATKSVEADHVAGGRRKHEQAAIVRYTPPKRLSWSGARERRTQPLSGAAPVFRVGVGTPEHQASSSGSRRCSATRSVLLQYTSFLARVRQPSSACRTVLHRSLAQASHVTCRVLFSHLCRF